MKKILTVAGLAIIVFYWGVCQAEEKEKNPVRRAGIKTAAVKKAPEEKVKESRVSLLSPVIRVEPDSLSFTLPRFLWTTQNFHIYNDGDQPLTVSITDIGTGGARLTANQSQKFSAELLRQKLLRRLRNLRLHPSNSPPRGSSVSSSIAAEAIVINDPAGDVPNPGIDVVSVEISQNVLAYIFKINFAGAPDSSALPILSIDLDQNFGSGAFPSPLGFGPGFFDVGSEYDIIFDVGNFLGDTLGLSASAYVIAGGDTSFTPAGVSLPLSIGSNSVEAQFIKFLTPQIIDDHLNASLVSLSLASLELPDFAPGYGHGLLGQENGLSWLTELDSAGFSAIPLQGTIAPGNSMPVQVKLVTVNPEGNYSAEVYIANNSANNPNVIVPVSVSIMGVSNPAILVSPAQISDTLMENQHPEQYGLTIANTGVGTLLYLVSDSLPPGENWLTIPGLGIGQLGGGESDVVPVEVNPAGLAANQSYSGFVIVTSNAAGAPRVEIPVEIYIQGASGIAEAGTRPKDFALYPNFPNPFNPSTNLGFRIADGSTSLATGFGFVRLEVFDVTGQKIATLVNQELAPGEYKVHWNGRDETGKAAASGIYLYRLQAGEHVFVRKMVLLK